MPATLLAWKELRRNTLLGFATIQLGALKIHDVTLHQQNGKRWVRLPAKPLINAAEDRTMKDHRGKILYAAVLEWSSKDAAERFCAGVFNAVEAAHPDALAST